MLMNPILDLGLADQRAAVLIVGDGDFSYSASLVAFHHAHRRRDPTRKVVVVATVLEADEEALVAQYPSAAGNLAAMRRHAASGAVGVVVLFGIDATRLDPAMLLPHAAAPPLQLRS